MHAILVKVKVKKEYQQAFLDASFVDASESLQKEAGCLRFDVFQDTADDLVIYFYELYSNEQAFEDHLKTPHFLKWKETIKDDWFIGALEINRCQLLFP